MNSTDSKYVGRPPGVSEICTLLVFLLDVIPLVRELWNHVCIICFSVLFVCLSIFSDIHIFTYKLLMCFSKFPRTILDDRVEVVSKDDK